MVDAQIKVVKSAKKQAISEVLLYYTQSLKCDEDSLAQIWSFIKNFLT